MKTLGYMAIIGGFLFILISALGLFLPVILDFDGIGEYEKDRMVCAHTENPAACIHGRGWKGKDGLR